MEVEIKNIIRKIKDEGIDEARKQAEEITAAAEKKARETLEKAEKKKTEIIENALREEEKIKEKSEEAMRQACRDVILGLKEDITVLFDRVVKRQVGEALTTDALKEMLIRIAEKFDLSGKASLDVLLSEQDRKVLEESLLTGLKRELASGITLKASSGAIKGFRIGKKDSNVYYDFTDEAIEESLRAYLNKRLARILLPEKEK